MVFSKGIRIEDKQIEAVKQWPEPQLVRDIQLFLGFANFYKRFIQGFSRIAATFTSILKTAEPKKGRDGFGGGSRARRGRSEIDDVEVDGGEVEVDEVGKKARNLSKSKKTVGSDFFTPGAKLAFTKLRQAFLKALILHYFDPKCYIRIETDASGYAIGGVISQLISDNLGQWHPVAFFSRKIIPAETRYKTHNGEFLVIVEAFKTWRHYLEGS